MSYKLGILGGMGPSATITLYQKIVNKTVACNDQEHLEMVVLNKCSIPDRTKALVNGGDDPLPKLNEGINELIKLGCKYFIVPCNTAHAYKNKFNNLDKIEFIDMIDETLSVLESVPENICLLCTYGTREVNVYGKGKKIVYPNDVIQKKVMDVITNTKAGKNEKDNLKEIIKAIDNKNILFGCTELSIYYDGLKKDDELKDFIIFDALEILAVAALKKCGKDIK